MHNPTYQMQEIFTKKSISQNQAEKNILAYDYPKSKSTKIAKMQDNTQSSAVDSTYANNIPSGQAAIDTFNSQSYNFPKGFSKEQRISNTDKQAVDTFARDYEMEQTNYINLNVNYDIPKRQDSKH